MKKRWILLAALSFASVGCGSSDAGTQDVAVSFAAMVGESEFVCGDSYDNLGSDNTTLSKETPR